MRRPGSRTLRVMVAAGGLLLLVLAALLSAPDSGQPLDPRSAGATGLRGLVDLVEATGGHVDIAIEPPSEMATRVLLPVDRLGDDRRDRWDEWVRAGGVLVIADPTSSLAERGPPQAPVTAGLGAVGRAPDCDLPAVAEVGEVRHAAWAGTAGEVGDATCFPVGDDHHWLVAREEGDGLVVVLGSPEPFTNQRLDQADNAVLALGLLAPRAGVAVQVVPPPGPGEGEAALTSLIPGQVRDALLLGLAALVVAALWRGRRLGPPPVEVMPPTVPAAELVRSVGDLLHRTGNRDDAARRLRADARLLVAMEFGVPADAAAGGTSVDLVAHRTGLPREVVATALVEQPLAADDQLPEVADAVSRLREALPRTRHP